MSKKSVSKASDDEKQEFGNTTDAESGNESSNDNKKKSVKGKKAGKKQNAKASNKKKSSKVTKDDSNNENKNSNNNDKDKKKKQNSKAIGKKKTKDSKKDDSGSDNENEEDEDNEETKSTKKTGKKGGIKEGPGNKETQNAKLTFNTKTVKRRIVGYFESKDLGKPRFRNSSHVYLTSVLENICLHIYDRAIKEAVPNKKGVKVLIRKNIKRGISNDKELKQLFMNAIINFDKNQDYEGIDVISKGDASKLLNNNYEETQLTAPGTVLIRYLVNNLYVRMSYLANELINNTIDKTLLLSMGLIDEEEEEKKKADRAKKSKKSKKAKSDDDDEEKEKKTSKKPAEKSISLIAARCILNALMINSQSLVKELNKKALVAVKRVLEYEAAEKTRREEEKGKSTGKKGLKGKGSKSKKTAKKIDSDDDGSDKELSSKENGTDAEDNDSDDEDNKKKTSNKKASAKGSGKKTSKASSA